MCRKLHEPHPCRIFAGEYHMFTLKTNAMSTPVIDSQNTTAGVDLTTYTTRWFLPAGDTDAQGLMSVTQIVARTIESATLHANALGIGYSNLNVHHLGWVLARLAVEVVRYPAINETYSMTTWIEGFNRYFSDRCFEMNDSDGNIIARIRTVWVAIDITKRAMADISYLERNGFPTLPDRCPLAKCRQPMIARGAERTSSDYTFTYCDIDFNRHVNTVRYIMAVLNQWPLSFYDNNEIKRLEVSFDQECLFGETVSLQRGTSARNPEAVTTEIINAAGKRAVGVELLFAPRKK